MVVVTAVGWSGGLWWYEKLCKAPDMSASNALCTGMLQVRGGVIAVCLLLSLIVVSPAQSGPGSGLMQDGPWMVSLRCRVRLAQ